MYRLVAERDGLEVSYRLEGWPRGGGGAAALLVAAGRASLDGHAGELSVDVAHLRALDPVAAAPAGDALHLAYDVTAGTLALELDGAHYRHAAGADGARFVFATDGGAVHAAWRADGAGRAVVGDGAAAVVECWDARFRRVFFAGPGGSEGDAAACADVPR